MRRRVRRHPHHRLGCWAHSGNCRFDPVRHHRRCQATVFRHREYCKVRCRRGRRRHPEDRTCRTSSRRTCRCQSRRRWSGRRNLHRRSRPHRRRRNPVDSPPPRADNRPCPLDRSHHRCRHRPYPCRHLPERTCPLSNRHRCRRPSRRISCRPRVPCHSRSPRRHRRRRVPRFLSVSGSRPVCRRHRGPARMRRRSRHCRCWTAKCWRCPDNYRNRRRRRRHPNPPDRDLGRRDNYQIRPVYRRDRCPTHGRRSR